MFPFAFQSYTIQQTSSKLDETALLSSLLMTILENERLTAQINSQQSQEISFSLKKGEFNRQQEYQLQVELKQVKIDNLTAMVRELQGQVVSGQKQLQDALQRCATLQISSRQEIAELKTQMLHYKNKYEQQSQNGKKCAKLQSQFKMLKLQLQARSKEFAHRTADLQNNLSKSEKGHELVVLQHQRKCKQLRNQIDILRMDLANKQQQCFSLKTSLDDCPKIEQLNRWIAKVKEYEQKQMQACAKMSQMSQQLCSARQKLRRLQSEHRQLQKVKQQLETALTENKGNEDSMVIYFDRLQTYEKVIKQLEEELRRMQLDKKNEEKSHQTKVELLEKEKEAVVMQWKAIAEEMSKQKTILSSLQQEVENYQSYIAQQNEKQNQLIRNEQITAVKQQKALEQQRQRSIQQQRKRQQTSYGPYSFVENSKCSERSNRSLSLHNRRTDYRVETQQESSNIMQSHLIYEQPYRQSRASPAIGRASSEQRIVYHSDAHSRNSTSRMNTQSSSGCGQCMSRVHDPKNDLSNRSLPPQQLRGDVAAHITDEKKLLMEKLNILKPHDSNTALRADRNISTLYSKNFRQANPTSQNLLKLNTSTTISKQTAYQASSHRLQLGRRQQKQNLNDMIVKRYANLMQRP